MSCDSLNNVSLQSLSLRLEKNDVILIKEQQYAIPLRIIKLPHQNPPPQSVTLIVLANMVLVKST
jgi:hypothetical protein